jgi:anti-anti-sigma regulatory factor
MDLRINKEMVGTKTVIQVHGRLAGNGVTELKKSCNTTGSPPVLDLTNLHSADSHGIELIRELSEKGSELIGTNPYFQMLLDLPAK